MLGVWICGLVFFVGLMFFGFSIQASPPEPSDPFSGARIAAKFSAIIGGIGGVLITLAVIIVSILKGMRLLG